MFLHESISKLPLLALLSLALGSLAACGTSMSNSAPNAPYPGLAYPGPGSTGADLAPGLGAVKAAFYYSDSGRPIRHQIFYITKLLPVTGNQKGAVVPSLDMSTAPQGESTESGNVLINNIPPGQYALSLMTPLGPILVVDANDNTEVIFEVTADQTTDLGNKNIFADSSLLEP